jgi:MFS family permease
MKKNIFLYFIVSLFLIFEMAIQVSPSVMATNLIHDLHISVFGLGIMSGIYFYSYTAMQIPSGLLFDRFHPRIIITAAILLCTCGTLLLSFAENIYFGSLARLLMGFGSAFAFVSVLIVTAELFDSRHFATITGVTQMLAAIGAMSGQIPISVLVSHIGWRHSLQFLSLLGLLLAMIIWASLKYQKNTRQNHAYLKPLKKILSHNQTWYIALYACLLWAPMSSFASLWGVPFLMKTQNMSQMSAAFFCSFMWIGLALASPLQGLLAKILRYKIIALALFALIGAIAFACVIKFNFPPLLLGFFIFLSGAACSGQALSFSLVKENNSDEVKGAAIAFNNMAVVISGALFQPLIGKCIDLNNAIQFRNGLSILLFAYIIAFLTALFFIKEPKKSGSFWKLSKTLWVNAT